MDRQLAFEYHESTKHHYHRFARSLGYLDWATQPNPFRSYAGAPRVTLLRAQPDRVAFDELFTPAPSSVVQIDLRGVSLLLRFSLGLSAWKQFGRSRWALRVNPSSGNLHPTEGYVIAAGLDGRPGTGVFHYLPEQHAIEKRYEDEDSGERLGCDPSRAMLVGLTTIHWREAWKYGERAFRYCQHDTGHAIAAVALAARLLGWDARLVPASSDEAAVLLGVDRAGDFGDAEREEPSCLIRVGRPELEVTRVEAPPLGGAWSGAANRLSVERIDWPIIDEVARATRTPGPCPIERHPLAPAADVLARDVDAATIILKRRSAVALDGQSAIDRETFVRMLERVMPADTPPWTALPWAPRVHLALFVHRVTGIDPGIYVLLRNREAEAFVRSELQRDFLWSRVPGVQDSLPLFCLARGDCRRLAARLSCHQEIAADGFFSLGMIAEFEPVIESGGASAYRRLFWECGVVGQVLYLEAEAAGVRSTGIGCFFDEPVHDTLGIFSRRLQSLYHFTVGVAVEDTRLTMERGYGWEEEGEEKGKGKR
jgi:SagB-type dehydrogenase family enzyme